MSQYMTLYLKSNKNEFCPLGTFSRNTTIYRTLENNLYLKYEDITALTHNDINICVTDLDAQLTEYCKHNGQIKSTMNAIMSASDPLENKLQMYLQYQNYLDDNNETMEELEAAKHYFTTLRTIIEAAEETAFEDCELTIDPLTYIFVGWECGNPNLNKEEI